MRAGPLLALALVASAIVAEERPGAVLVEEYREDLLDAFFEAVRLASEEDCARGFEEATGKSLKAYLDAGPIRLVVDPGWIGKMTAAAVICVSPRRVFINSDWVRSLPPRLYAGAIIHEVAHLVLCEEDGIKSVKSERLSKKAAEACVPEVADFY